MEKYETPGADVDFDQINDDNTKFRYNVSTMSKDIVSDSVSASKAIDGFENKEEERGKESGYER